MRQTTKCFKTLVLAAVAAIGVTVRCPAQEIIDPKLAAKDPDFAVQGEYLGEGQLWPDGRHAIGVQVVALGDGKFDVYILKGGLPGEGWKRGDPGIRDEAKREGSVVTFGSAVHHGTIADGKMMLYRRHVTRDSTPEGKYLLKRVERKSPTLDAKPPAGAKVLFDGSGTERFAGGVLTEWKTLLSGPATKDKFNSFTLHLEFNLSWMPKARGQGRSNSGVYPHDCYEIQVLDSFGLEGQNNECGGFYSIKAPDVNMCLPPLVWQTYDIDFTAPQYDASGKKTANARITVRHNGVVIHDNLVLPKGTPGRAPEGPGPRVLYLQGHGNKVQYRNIWLVEK